MPDIIPDLRPVLVTTQHRGVFGGLIRADADLIAKAMPLQSARMCIRWRGLKGLLDLCHSGPNDQCVVSAPADAMLYDITGVFAIEAEAWAKWEAA